MTMVNPIETKKTKRNMDGASTTATSYRLLYAASTDRTFVRNSHCKGFNGTIAVATAELAILEQRIAELERTLAEVELVTDSGEMHTEVSIGSHVVIRDTEGDQEEYVIVDHVEADPRLGRLSQTSPVGSALLGCH